MPDIRADRLFTLNIVEPLQRVLRTDVSARIPILMYHGISDEIGGRHPYFETNTSIAVFASHMQYLRARGYRSVSMQAAMQAIAAGKVLPRTVIITFDDACKNFYTNAMSILQDCSLTATLFVITGIAAGRPHCFGSTEFMSWQEIQQAAQSGIEIGSHTVSHPRLHTLSAEKLRRELEESKWALEDKLGKPVETISYPYAFPEQDLSFRQSLRKVAQRAGYTCGVTTVVGRAAGSSDQYFLPRLPVNEHDDLRLFKAKLEGAYDWIRGPQVLYKRLAVYRPGKSRIESVDRA